MRDEIDWPQSWGHLLDDVMPKVEEYREGGTLVVRAEMPGIDPDKDVEVTVSDGRLRLEAQRRQEETTEGKEGYRSEFRYGSFVRTLSLPAGATEDDVVANYEDGILEVRIPVSTEQAETRKVPITRG
jgi:HSP20 family protein